MKQIVIACGLVLTGCAGSPERAIETAEAIDARYRAMDCPALAKEAEALEAEISRAEATINSASQWVPVVNLFTWPGQNQALRDLESARARQGGVTRAQDDQNCRQQSAHKSETEPS